VVGYATCELRHRAIYRLRRHEMIDGDGFPVGPMLALAPWWDARDWTACPSRRAAQGRSSSRGDPGLLSGRAHASQVQAGGKQV